MSHPHGMVPRPAAVVRRPRLVRLGLGILVVGAAALPSAAARAAITPAQTQSAAARATSSAPDVPSPPDLDPWGTSLGAGQPSDGQAAPPSRDVASVLRAQSSARSQRSTSAPRGSTAATAWLPFPFVTHGYRTQSVPTGWLPYTGPTLAPRVDPSDHDDAGVRMYRIGGTLYNHPVRQAQWGLTNVNSYTVSKDQFYLDRAIAQARRLVDIHIDSRDAWYFPYAFDFTLHGRPDELMRAPWYSAMAQGQALSLFVRLAQVTGDSQWRNAADGTFASFLKGPEPGLPWVVHTDDGGYLWLEEYPVDAPGVSDYTYNGHMYALFGIYDYARATADPRAEQIFDGAATTTDKFARNGLRNPGWISFYCPTHRVISETYHWSHTDELMRIAAETGVGRFAQSADELRDDYPPYQIRSTVRIPDGEITGVQLDAAGDVTATQTVTFPVATTVPSDQRRRVTASGPIYLRLSAGPLAGFSVVEQPDILAPVGQFFTISYPVTRHAKLPAGQYTLYRFPAGSADPGPVPYEAQHTMGVRFSQTSMWLGRRYALITAGPLQGLWLATDNLVLPAT